MSGRASNASAPMRHRLGLPGQDFFALWAALFLMVLLYSSTIVGPLGYHYVPMDAAAAWARLLASEWVEHGSDQRADWMGNLVTLVPFGFLVAGAVMPRSGPTWRGLTWRLAGGAASLTLCLLVVIGIKYLQLFFPPRTVTLNYIVAQSAGVAIGVAGFAASLWLAARLRVSRLDSGRAVLIPLLGAYSALIVLFSLAPFDFVVSAEDWAQRREDLWEVLTSLPGEGRSWPLRLALTSAGMVAFAPIGLLLALRRPRLGVTTIAAIGVAAMALLIGVNMLVLSGEPHLVSIVTRGAGITAGAAALYATGRLNLARIRRAMPDVALWLVVPYLLAVFAVNNLFGQEWLGLREAIERTDSRVFLPLFVFYIVTKATAAFSVGAHLLMYFPLGVLAWMRGGDTGRVRLFAAVSAAGLSGIVELARLLQPGPTPDFNEIAVGFVAGYLAVRLMGAAWPALEIVAREQSGLAPAAPAARPAPPKPAPANPALAAPERVRPPSVRVTERVRPATPPPPDPKSRWTRFATTREAAAHEDDDYDDNARDAAAWEAIAERVSGLVLAASCLGLAIWGALSYPLAGWAFAAVLLAYAGVMWRWPGAWLVVVPAILPVFDLSPWTGWLFITEADLFILVSLAMLLVRTPPRLTDLWPAGLAGSVLGLVCFAAAMGVWRGLTLPDIPEGGSANPYLMSENAWRLIKPLVWMVLLLPFIRGRARSHGDTVMLFGTGMVAALFAVTFLVVLERALFVGVFDFSSDYRVVGPFSSMHVGGGHIGAFVAMALPFLAVFALQRRAWSKVVLVLGALAGVYTLVVTFARMAFAAALVGMAVLVVLWMVAGWGRRVARRAWLVPALVALAVGGGVLGAAVGTSYMSSRLATASPDLAFREANWQAGLDMRDPDFTTTLLGMGLGSYGRAAFMRDNATYSPTNFTLDGRDWRIGLTITQRSPFYFGQKIYLRDDRLLRMILTMRSDDPQAAVTVSLCRNLLLYSADCRGETLISRDPGHWHDMLLPIETTGLRSTLLFGLIAAPIELSLSVSHGAPVAITALHLVDPDGRDLLSNGDFTRGTQRWYFTDDEHWRWRIFNQYLMSFFEGGVLGLVALVALAGAGIAEGFVAVRRGARPGAIVVASVAAFLCSGLVDSPLEAPRLACVFYLIVGCGLTYRSSARDGRGRT